MNKSRMTSPLVMKYVMDNTLRMNEHQKKLYEWTQQTEGRGMLASLDMVQYFQLLLKAIGAKRCIEIGTFTGYTTLSMAQVLPDDGQVVTCDVEDKKVAFDIWKDAKVDHKIKFHLGPAVQTLDNLLKRGESGSFDFAFIDADKTVNRDYYERCLKLVRPGGIICIDNVIWGGRVADENVTDATTENIREFNRFLSQDPRVDSSMLTVGDGAYFCLKN